MQRSAARQSPQLRAQLQVKLPHMQQRTPQKPRRLRLLLRRMQSCALPAPLVTVQQMLRRQQTPGAHTLTLWTSRLWAGQRALNFRQLEMIWQSW